MTGGSSKRQIDQHPLRLIIVLSGKRKSGKDHVSSLLMNMVGSNRARHLAILRIAGPIKKTFARENKLDSSRLFDSSSYKEHYRLAMVEWSENYRKKNGWNTFLIQAIQDQDANSKTIWILNDARRPCDLEFFENNHDYAETKLIKIRIEADDETRSKRGWTFVAGIDDKDTECGLDSYQNWTYVINNSSKDAVDLEEALRPVYDAINDALTGL